MCKMLIKLLNYSFFFKLQGISFDLSNSREIIDRKYNNAHCNCCCYQLIFDRFKIINDMCSEFIWHGGSLHSFIPHHQQWGVTLTDAKNKVVTADDPEPFSGSLYKVSVQE